MLKYNLSGGIEMTTTTMINIAIEIFGSVMCLVFLICILVGDNLKIQLNRVFIWVLLSNIALMISDALAFYSIGKTEPIFFLTNHLGNFFTFIFSYIIIMCFSNYINTYLVFKIKIKRYGVYLVYGVCGFAIALTFLSKLNNMYYIIDENNIYHRQELYWLSQLLGIIALLINAFVIIRHRKHLNRMEKFALSVYIILPVTAVVIQMLIYGFVSVYIASTITIMIMYVGMQAQHARMMKEKELQLVQNRITIMLSQIQPHFLYNALNTIQYLCLTQPTKASKVIEDFSHYLRGNMDSLVNKDNIEFTRELEHLEHYLSIERIRFPGLSIFYDLKAMDFCLPALTLQPIVENAIIHGVTQSEKSNSTVKVISYENEAAWILKIDDNGIGFDPNKEIKDGRSHIGISNTRNRLESMCGGSLDIDSTPGNGTCVTIQIPKTTVNQQP